MESTILKVFLEASGESVSGDGLAKALGVSRVSVWQRLEKLRAEGFVFEGAPRKGYVLTAVPSGLHAALLDAHLRLLRVRPVVTFLSETDSTNSEAERRLAAGQEAPFAVLAGRQTAGRGRLGRRWASAHPENLYASFAFRPFLPPERLSAFTVFVGLRVCEKLASLPGMEDLRLKWPNDLVFRGRKIAGMLTEARMDADQVRDLVFGLGLNINGDPAAMPADLQAVAGSLAHASGRSFDIHAIVASVIATVFDACDEFLNTSRAPDPRSLFARFDALSDLDVTVSLRGEPLSGVASGVDASGALLLRKPSGKIVRVNAGEVTLRRPAPSRARADA